VGCQKLIGNLQKMVVAAVTFDR